MQFAYADPPYFGYSVRYYGDQHPEAWVYDTKEGHLALLDRLKEEYPGRWALSCMPGDLRWLLPECPVSARVGVYIKTNARPSADRIAQVWEPVIYDAPRSTSRGRGCVKDVVSCGYGPSNKRITIGAKPAEFTRWLLALLNVAPDDELVDMFSGSGAVNAVAQVPRLL